MRLRRTSVDSWETTGVRSKFARRNVGLHSRCIALRGVRTTTTRARLGLYRRIFGPDQSPRGALHSWMEIDAGKIDRARSKRDWHSRAQAIGCMLTYGISWCELTLSVLGLLPTRSGHSRVSATRRPVQVFAQPPICLCDRDWPTWTTVITKKMAALQRMWRETCADQEEGSRQTKVDPIRRARQQPSNPELNTTSAGTS